MQFSRTRLSDVLHRKACAFVQPAVVGTLYKPYFSYRVSVGEPDIPCSPVLDLVPLAQVRSHPLFHMTCQMRQVPCCNCAMEVADPPSYRGVDLIYNPVKRPYRPRSAREFGHSLFDIFRDFFEG